MSDGSTVLPPTETLARPAGLIQLRDVERTDAITEDVVTDVPQSFASFWSISHWRIRPISLHDGSIAAYASRIRAVVPVLPIDQMAMLSSDGHHMPFSGDVSAYSLREASTFRATD